MQGIVDRVVAGLAQHAMIHHREDDAAEVIGAADIPVAQHRRREQAVALDGQIAKPHAQLLAGDVPILLLQGLDLLMHTLGGEGQSIAYEEERVYRVWAGCVGKLLPIHFRGLTLLLLLLAHGGAEMNQARAARRSWHR